MMRLRSRCTSRFVASLLLILSLVAVTPPVFAQQDTPATQSALAVSPAIIEEVLEPGKLIAFSLQVNNVTNFPLPVKGMAQGFTVQSAELEKTEARRLDAAKWITIEEPDFILQPNQVRIVKGTIQPPADAIPGGHYATIFFQPLVPVEVLSPTTTQLNAKVGVLVFMVVKGDIKQQAAYAKHLESDSFISRGTLRFTASIRNSGNVHLFPNGKLVIYDSNGKRLKELPVPVGAVLPGATREYVWDWGAPDIFGHYRAELEMTYGDENTILTKMAVTFWVIPWVEILGGTLLLGGVALFIGMTRLRWRKVWQILHGKDL